MSVAAIKDRGIRTYDHARERWPALDHAARAVAYYGDVLGGQLAAGITYFAFLSFFPLVALAFSIVGFVVAYVPDAGAAVTSALSAVLPGMVGSGPSQINVQAIASAKAGVGIIGLLGLLYAGLGWISALRTSLERIFSVAGKAEHNFVTAKLYDLLGLVVIGVGLVLSVGAGGLVTGYADRIADWLGLAGSTGVELVLRLVAIVVGIAVMAVLFYFTYRVLPDQHLPDRALWQGALLAAVGFEVLRLLAGIVLRSATTNPIYGAFAIMVALLIWINYTARLVVIGACWAATGAVGPDEDRPEEPS